jgi:hypothetical protein
MTANSQIDNANVARANGLTSNANALTNNANGLTSNTNALANWNNNAINAQNNVIQAGQLQDQAKQQQLDSDLNKFQAQDNSGWTRLGLLQSAASGAAGNYGTNTTTQTTPNNPLSFIGAGLGGLGQLAKKSDIRLKENIFYVGRNNGHRLYEWNYKGGRQRFRGVMAQDIPLIQQDAVVMGEDGFYAVRYDVLGIEMEAA